MTAPVDHGCRKSQLAFATKSELFCELATRADVRGAVVVFECAVQAGGEIKLPITVWRLGSVAHARGLLAHADEVLAGSHPTVRRSEDPGVEDTPDVEDGRG